MAKRRRSKLPYRTQKKLESLFERGESARAAARITQVNRNTASLFFKKIRQELFKRQMERHQVKMSGRVELDLAHIRFENKTLSAAYLYSQRNGFRVLDVSFLNSKEILAVLLRHIEVSSTVCTDDFYSWNWWVYRHLKRHYSRVRVKHEAVLKGEVRNEIANAEWLYFWTMDRAKKSRSRVFRDFTGYVAECEMLANYKTLRNVWSEP